MKTADLSSQIDGNRTIFSLPENYETGSLRVYYNGVRESTSVTEINQFQFQFDFTPSGAGVELIIDYKPQST